jgi:hypothetical protein
MVMMGVMRESKKEPQPIRLWGCSVTAAHDLQLVELQRTQLQLGILLHWSIPFVALIAVVRRPSAWPHAARKRGARVAARPPIPARIRARAADLRAAFLRHVGCPLSPNVPDVGREGNDVGCLDYNTEWGALLNPALADGPCRPRVAIDADDGDLL